MAILVTAASKYGSTLEIGVAIRDELNARGLDAEFLEPSAVDDPRRYDAFIVGSAIYMGRWQAPAREFLSAHREVLAERPVWLFSSGPLALRRQAGPRRAGLWRAPDHPRRARSGWRLPRLGRDPRLGRRDRRGARSGLSCPAYPSTMPGSYAGTGARGMMSRWRFIRR